MLSQATAQRGQYRKLSELTPSSKNPRLHSDERIAGRVAACAIQSPGLAEHNLTGRMRMQGSRDSDIHKVSVPQAYLGERHAN